MSAGQSRLAAEVLSVSLPTKLAPYDVDPVEEPRVEFRPRFGLVAGTQSDLGRVDKVA